MARNATSFNSQSASKAGSKMGTPETQKKKQETQKINMARLWLLTYRQTDT